MKASGASCDEPCMEKCKGMGMDCQPGSCPHMAAGKCEMKGEGHECSGEMKGCSGEAGAEKKDCCKKK
jgi:hypothetical protein